MDVNFYCICSHVHSDNHQLAPRVSDRDISVCDVVVSFPPTCTHLKDLLPGHLYAAVSCLRLLQGQLVSEQLRFMDQVSLVVRRPLSVPSSAAPHSSPDPLFTPDVHLGAL